MTKVFVSVYPFCEYHKYPLEILEQTNCEVSFNPFKRKLKPQELKDFALDADCVIAGTEDMNLLIDSSNSLKHISRVGIGLDSVPLEKCKQKGIRVSYTPDAVTLAVAELTLGLMITLSRFVVISDKNMRNNLWNRLTGKRIGESVVGIVGLGRVGTKVVEFLSEFNPKEILINDIQDKTQTIRHLQKEHKLKIRATTKEEIFQNSDIVTLHIPLTTKTNNLLNFQTFQLFHKDTFLINTSRGGIIEENALYEVLLEKKIKGAAVDVFPEEPYSGNLTQLENIIITPHIGSCSFDCRRKMESQATEEVVRFIKQQDLLLEVPLEEYEYQRTE